MQQLRLQRPSTLLLLLPLLQLLLHQLLQLLFGKVGAPEACFARLGSSLAAAAPCPSIYKHRFHRFLLLLLLPLCGRSLLRGVAEAVRWVDWIRRSKTLPLLLYVQALAALPFRYSSNQHAGLQKQHTRRSGRSGNSIP